MKTKQKSFFLLKSICCFFIIIALHGGFGISRSVGAADPPSKGGKWYRGNTHTHAKLSDENDENDVPVIAGWYESAGYDFMILSEHNDHLYKKKIFCHDEVTKPGKFLILCGLELSETRHHTALGIDRFIAEEESLQDGVNKTLEAGGIPILNHPQAPVISASEFIKTEGLNHFEVFNGGRPKHTPPTEMLWDSILSAPNGRIVYAVASDDNHYSKSNVGKGWIMVNAPALTKDDIKENIRKGNFYATTGVILNDINTTRSKITIISKNGDTITFIEMYGKTLSTVSGNKATYRIKGDENYVRAKITNSEGEMAWTQPVKVK